MSVEPERLLALAEEWYAAWNAHDLDAILAHYAPEIVLRSPYVRALGADPDGVLRGADALRAYWRTALDRYPELRFEPLATLLGVDSVVLHYRGLGGVRAAELLRVRAPDGLVTDSIAHYESLP